MRIQAGYVGQRVVLRCLTGGIGPSGGPAMTDVVGRLLDVTETIANIQRRDGQVVSVDTSTVLICKPIPEQPQRIRNAARFAPEELAQITSRGWPAVESAPLGDWELRASHGFTSRANSVGVWGEPGRPLAEALELAADFYGSRGLPALAQVAVGTRNAEAFEAAGWIGSPEHPGATVYTYDLGADDPGKSEADALIEIRPQASLEWLELYDRARDDKVIARKVLEGPRTVGFATLDVPPVAIGRVAVTGEWAGIAEVAVLPEHRRQGSARRITTSLLRWAADQGANKAYIQVRDDNQPAIALYRSLGFQAHHAYRYLSPPT